MYTKFYVSPLHYLLVPEGLTQCSLLLNKPALGGLKEKGALLKGFVITVVHSLIGF